MLQDGLRWSPVLAEQDRMEARLTDTHFNTADPRKQGDDGTFLGHAQMVPHDCLSEVAFEVVDAFEDAFVAPIGTGSTAPMVSAN
jgi:hypothetical protein